MRSLNTTALAAIVLTLGTSGCFSVATVHTAHPVSAGETEVGINAGIYGAMSSSENAYIPQFELQLRRGINENVDIGAKIYPIGVAVDVNYMFLEGLSLDPTFSGLSFSTSSGGTKSSIFIGVLTLPLLYDLVHTDALTLTVGAKAGLVYASGTSSSTEEGAAIDVSERGTTFTYGGSIGSKLRISDGFAIMPAFDVLALNGSGTAIYQFNVGLLF